MQPSRSATDADAPPSSVAPSPRFTLPDVPPPRVLPLSVAADPSWVKPLEATIARADAQDTAATTFAWYVGLAHARVRVTYVEDVPYLTDPDRPHGEASGPGVRSGPV